MIQAVRSDRRPPTVNAMRRLVPHQRGRVEKEWREEFFMLAKKGRVQPYDVAVEIVVRVWLRKGTSVQDIGACFNAYKAALDGLVDAGVLPDDTPKWVKRVTFEAPITDTKEDGIELRLYPA